MYFLLKMGIFQPAMLVYQRVGFLKFLVDVMFLVLVERLKDWRIFSDFLIPRADYNSISSFCWVAKKNKKTQQPGDSK